MIDQRAVGRYAEALFQLADKRKELEKVDKHFEELRELIAKHPEISHLVLNPTVGRAEKEDFMEKIMPAHASETLVHFIMVLMKKGRFRALEAVQKRFHRLVENRQGIREVVAVAARPLSKTNVTKLKAVLRKRLKNEIRLIPETDPHLIGGLVLRFDGREIDASFRNRLNEMKQKILS